MAKRQASAAVKVKSVVKRVEKNFLIDRKKKTSCEDGEKAAARDVNLRRA
ncbi:MAG: hypothetical protein ACE5EI_02345 [Thermodesulfobacteriota bacterium]